MEILVCNSKIELGKKAAGRGAKLINDAVQKYGFANIIVATGASQFEMLSALVKEDIDWTKVKAFHLDEYIGISAAHPASFRKYLKERFVDKVNIKEFVYINGEGDIRTECARLNNMIKNLTINVAFIGIGENTHLAFNDPPADFETIDPYISVKLDDDCRKQQLGEGWFSTIEDVPEKAISMSIHQIMKSQAIICCVPDMRKAEAVKKTLESDISPNIPSSILRTHPATSLFLDRYSASSIQNKK